jgi:hypothetical protein
MQRKAALELQMEQLQPHKAAAAAAAAAELAATAAAHQTYPYGIPEHLLQQEQEQQLAEQQQTLAESAEGCTSPLEEDGGSVGYHAVDGAKFTGQCLSDCISSNSMPVLEQQQQQQQPLLQEQPGQDHGQQLEPAAEPAAYSAPHVTWREEPNTQEAAAVVAGSSAGNCAAAASSHGGWHGLVVDCSSPGDEALGSEQLHDEDAQASLLLQRPNTGNACGMLQQPVLIQLARA